MSTPMKKYSTPAYVDNESGETEFGSVDVYLASEVDARIAEEHATQLRLCEEAQIAAGTIAQQGCRIAELESELSVHARDTARLDWLADPSNAVGGVTLPREIVLRNVHSLRDAIDEAMSQCT